MPDTTAEIIAIDGKKVTITIAEVVAEDTKIAISEEEPNSFSIQVGTNRLTITIAE